MRNENIKYGYGDFGNLSAQYAEARQSFPKEVIAWFWPLVKNRDARILDLGCGTGISTRQIAEQGGAVIGCDKDAEMIAEAKRARDGLEYVVAPAEHLPFGDMEFDAVVAFSAFHWFANTQALSEIKRVLKPNGIFFIANKNDAGYFKRGYKEIIQNILRQELPEVKKNYAPELLLQEAGFTDVQVKDFAVSEYFTQQQAMAYFQSVSVWNLVPDDTKPAALKLLEDYCRERIMDGKIERKLNVCCVAGHVG